MKKPEIGSKVVYVKPTTVHRGVTDPDMAIGTVCIVETYLSNKEGIGVTFNRINRSALYWDEFRELTLLEKELYED